MLIEKIKQTYKKKSTDDTIIRKLESGEKIYNYYYEKGLLVKLNMAMDWKHSKFPEGEENCRELKEGDTFMLEGRPQVISIVDEDTIKLITSDTGPLALERIVREIINPELKMVYSDSDMTGEWEIVQNIEDPCCTESFVIPYDKYSIIKKRLIPGREDVLLKNFWIKISACGGYVPLPTEFYLDSSRIWFDPDFFEESQMKFIADDILSWMYKNIEVLGRHEFETERAEREEKEKRELTEKLMDQLKNWTPPAGCNGQCSSCAQSKNCTNPAKNLASPFP